MPRPIPPPLGIALTTLRSAQGWTQKELAGSTGISESLISDYEKGRRPLGRARLETLVAALGFSPEAVDSILFGLESARPEARSLRRPFDLSVAEGRSIQRARLAVARAASEAMRSELLRSLRDARVQQDRAEADELWSRLKPQAARDRRMLLEHAREYQTWALAERLCAESVKMAPAHAGQAVELADLALRTASLAPAEPCWRARLQGYAWAFVGNARRVGGDLPGSEEAFRRSRNLWAKGGALSPEPLDGARLLDLEASLRKHQGRFEEALSLLEEALVASRPENRGGLLLNKAVTLEQMGNAERAIAVLEQAVPWIDEHREPRLRCVLRFNQAVNLCHLGRHAEAQTLLPEVRALAASLGNELDLVRALWLGGRILAGLGQPEQAIAALDQVRRELAGLGIPYDAALVTLEIAALHLELGRTGEVKALARQMAPVFRAQGVHREALAAIELFCSAAHREVVTVDLTRRLVEFLEKAQRNPMLHLAP